MLDQTDKNELFHIYYKRWITVYKEGAIRKVTMAKYLMTQHWLEKLASNLCLCHLTRLTYQQLLNDYAAEHERQTTMDFHPCELCWYQRILALPFTFLEVGVFCREMIINSYAGLF